MRECSRKYPALCPAHVYSVGWACYSYDVIIITIVIIKAVIIATLIKSRVILSPVFLKKLCIYDLICLHNSRLR